jgi:hypothetical protein
MRILSNYLHIFSVMFPITKILFVINPDCYYVDKKVELNKFQKISVKQNSNFKNINFHSRKLILLFIPYNNSITFLILAILVLISTAFEWIYNHFFTVSTASVLVLIGKCFSVRKNLRHIFISKWSNQKFASLDGLRCILAFWLFVLHEYLLGMLPLTSKNLLNSASVHWFYED